MPVKYNILFYLKSDATREDRFLRCRVRWNNENTTLNVGYRVEVGKWNADTQRCVKSSTHGRNKVQASTINRAIEKMESQIAEYFNRCERNGTEPSVSGIRISVGKEIVSKSLFEVFDEFIDIVGTQNSWSKAQAAKMRTLRNHLHRFNPNISFGDLSEDALYDFVAYLQSVEAAQSRYYNAENGMKNTTISRTVGFLKTFLRWAASREYYGGNLHNTFRPKLKGLNVKTVIYLDWQELMSLYNHDFSHSKSLDTARDLFCFASFTALRYSDIERLSWADINIANNEITLVAQKTGKRTIIPLNNFSKSIIEKYSLRDSDKVFPMITNSLLNRRIKTAARLAGIDSPVRIVYYSGSERYEEVHPKFEVLSIHAGRRTFAVNALSMGISAFVVKEIGGWANMKAMAPYSAIVDSAKREALNKFNDWNGRMN